MLCTVRPSSGFAGTSPFVDDLGPVGAVFEASDVADGGGPTGGVTFLGAATIPWKAAVETKGLVVCRFFK